MGTHAEVIWWEDDENSPIVFYQHYDGYNICETVANALIKGEGRWHDSPYLARIVFTEMIKQTNDDTLGFGITNHSGYAAFEHTVSIQCHNEHGTKVNYKGKQYAVEDFIDIYSTEANKIIL